jgi:DNA-directed RNA polymerase subunit N (RpoN/RPB10)
MAFPVRCFTCNKVIGQYEERYTEMVEKGIDNIEIFKTLKIERYCCRRMFLGHVDLITQLLQYSDISEKPLDDNTKK